MEHIDINRANGRAANALRPVKLTRDVMKNALGSCLVEFGDTRVLCAATIEEGLPAWRRASRQGWVTAEYAMLPAATNRRSPRERANRKGRSMEIERLIGRSPAQPSPTCARWASIRSRSTAMCSRPTAAPAPQASPARGSRCTMLS